VSPKRRDHRTGERGVTDYRDAELRGTVRAVGFLLDARVIGETEARRRVLGLWTPGTRLRALPDGRWLLLLTAPVTIRAERAPGLVVLQAAAIDGNRIAERRHGGRIEHAVDELVILDPAAWLDSGRELVTLRRLDAEPVPAMISPRESSPPPDVRELAAVGSRTRTAHSLLRAAAEKQRAASRRPRRRGAIARLVLRTPIAGAVGRHHQRYLARLEKAFERRDYDTALRDAIGIRGDAAGGWLTLRLPARRTGPIKPTTSRTPGGGVVPWGGTAQWHLTQLYRRAAQRLEEDGEIERAAFVHADLLRNLRDAVSLLERHGCFELAAQVAEGHNLDPDLIVRLWWRAGDRQRAVLAARARGGWAQAVRRLQDLDSELARELRKAWVEAERDTGAYLAAIEAAWPDPELRNEIETDLESLETTGPTAAARAIAFRLAWRPTTTSLADAISLARDRSTAALARRYAFATVFGEHPSVDPIADRRVTTELIRALLRDGTQPLDGAGYLVKGGIYLTQAA